MQSVEPPRRILPLTARSMQIEYDGVQYNLPYFITECYDVVAELSPYAMAFSGCETLQDAAKIIYKMQQKIPRLNHMGRKLSDYRQAPLQEWTYLNDKNNIVSTLQGLIEIITSCNSAKLNKLAYRLLLMQRGPDAVEQAINQRRTTFKVNTENVFKKNVAEARGPEVVSEGPLRAADTTAEEKEEAGDGDASTITTLETMLYRACVHTSSVPMQNALTAYKAKLDLNLAHDKERFDFERKRQLSQVDLELELAEKDPLRKRQRQAMIDDLDSNAEASRTARAKLTTERVKTEAERTQVEETTKTFVTKEQAERVKTEAERTQVEETTKTFVTKEQAERTQVDAKRTQAKEAIKTLMAKGEAERTQLNAERTQAEEAVKTLTAKGEAERTQLEADKIKAEADKAEAELRLRNARHALDAPPMPTAPNPPLPNNKALDNAAALSRLIERYRGAALDERNALRPELHALLEPQYPEVRERAAVISAYTRFGRSKRVYVLTNGVRVYVGLASNPTQRIKQHQRGSGGAVWAGGLTQRATLLTKRNGLTDDQWERLETLAQMEAMGVDNVRGWRYTTLDNAAWREEAIDATQEAFSLCRRCSGRGHFVHQCTATDITKAALTQQKA